MKLGHECRFEISPVAPFHFELTMRKPAGWSLFNSGEILESGNLWTATRILGKIVGLKLRSTGTLESPHIAVTLFTALPVETHERTDIRRALAMHIGADQDLKSFYEMARKDNILTHAVKDLYGMHDTQSAYLFDSVVLSICLQMARMDRSERMMDAINRGYGTKVEFDGKAILVEPAAETIARLRPREFSRRCKLGYRAKYLIGAAKMIADGFPDALQIMRMHPDEAKKKLMELPGVGDYAADIINPHGGFPIDAWSVDVFSKLFFDKEPLNAREAVLSVKEEGRRRWGKFSWMAFFYVVQDLRNLSEHLGIQLRMH